MKRFGRTLLAIALLAIVPSLAIAQGYVSTDRFGYSGTVTRYGSLSDLQNQINGVSYLSPARDLGLYMVNNNAAFTGSYPPVEAIFISAWYLNGGQTPSNQNTGFIQMYDSDGGSINTMNMSWGDQARTMYNFFASGGNGVGGCSGAGDCGRLYNGSTASYGLFQSWQVAFSASGLAPAVWNATTGVWESVSNPTSVTGTMRGIFQNNSTTDLASNGWYEYNMTIDMNSWANDNGYLAGNDSYFGSDVTVTPEPASFALFATGIIGIAVIRRRRQAKS
jgi:hypothetical protein